MWESLARVNAVVGGVVWGPVGLALLFGTGCLLTVRTGFFQLRYFGYWMRHTIGAIFLDRNVTAHTDDEAISQFQSLCTALAATIGTGNIAGTAGALLLGGPGAIFWMWVSALLGMALKYAEILYAMRFRRRTAGGGFAGGPMCYIERGLPARWHFLAPAFALCAALAAGKLVLCDRFVDSSVAYQGGGRKLGVARVKEINAPAVDGTMPDATVYLDIDHVAAMKRRSAATTLESTPPDSARRTFLLPTCARISSICWAIKALARAGVVMRSMDSGRTLLDISASSIFCLPARRPGR